MYHSEQRWQRESPQYPDYPETMGEDRFRRSVTPRKTMVKPSCIENNYSHAQDNADFYEKYSQSPLKQSMGMYNSQAPSYSARKQRESFQKPYHNENPQKTRYDHPQQQQQKQFQEQSQDYQPLYRSSRNQLSRSPLKNMPNRSPLKERYSSNATMNTFNYEMNVEANGKATGSSYNYLRNGERGERNEEVRAIAAIDRRAKENNYNVMNREKNIGREVTETRTPRKEINPIIQKSEIIKQKIDKLARMTPRRGFMLREDEETLSHYQKSSNNYGMDNGNKNCNFREERVIYDAERSPKLASKSGIVTALPTPILSKEEDSCEAVTRKLYEDDDCRQNEGSASIREMSEKITSRLQSILQRHG